MTKEQQIVDANERGRLHHELSSLQRSLGEVQRQLTEERSSHQHSFSSVQTVQEAADARCRQLVNLQKLVHVSVQHCSLAEVIRMYKPPLQVAP